MYRVDGYEFEDKELAEKAAVEAEGIRYIRERTNLADPEIVLHLYQQMLDEDVFDTPVGIAFLTELQNLLKDVPYIKKEDIPSIPVKLSLHDPEAEALKKEKPDWKSRRPKPDRQSRPRKSEKPALKESASVKKYRKNFRISMFFTVVLACMVVGMLAITYVSGNNVTILNYENAIIDKYEEWEQDLKEREAAVKDKEEDLGIQDTSAEK